MNPIMLVRTSIGFCASIATSTATMTILKGTARHSNKVLDILMQVGSLAVSIVAGAFAQKAVEKYVDETVESIQSH